MVSPNIPLEGEAAALTFMRLIKLILISVVAIACTATSPASPEDPVVELVNYGIFREAD